MSTVPLTRLELTSGSSNSNESGWSSSSSAVETANQTTTTLLEANQDERLELVCRAWECSPRPEFQWLISWPVNESTWSGEQLVGGQVAALLNARIAHWPQPEVAPKHQADQQEQPAQQVAFAASRLVITRLSRSMQGARIGCRASQPDEAAELAAGKVQVSGHQGGGQSGASPKAAGSGAAPSEPQLNRSQGAHSGGANGGPSPGHLNQSAADMIEGGERGGGGNGAVGAQDRRPDEPPAANNSRQQTLLSQAETNSARSDRNRQKNYLSQLTKWLELRLNGKWWASERARKKAGRERERKRAAVEL